MRSGLHYDGPPSVIDVDEAIGPVQLRLLEMKKKKGGNLSKSVGRLPEIDANLTLQIKKKIVEGL